MKTVFVDTNVILDVLLQRDGFWQDSIKIFQLAELGEIEACASASSMTDIFYLTKKTLTQNSLQGRFEPCRGILKPESIAEDTPEVSAQKKCVTDTAKVI